MERSTRGIELPSEEARDLADVCAITAMMDIGISGSPRLRREPTEEERLAASELAHELYPRSTNEDTPVIMAPERFPAAQLVIDLALENAPRVEAELKRRVPSDEEPYARTRQDAWAPLNLAASVRSAISSS